MNTTPHTTESPEMGATSEVQTEATTQPKQGIGRTLVNGVLRGLGTVVGAVEGTLGLGHAAKTDAVSAAAEASQNAADARRLRGRHASNLLRTALHPFSKAWQLAPPLRKPSRARQAAIHAMAGSIGVPNNKALRHR